MQTDAIIKNASANASLFSKTIFENDVLLPLPYPLLFILSDVSTAFSNVSDIAAERIFTLFLRFLKTPFLPSFPPKAFCDKDISLIVFKPRHKS